MANFPMSSMQIPILLSIEDFATVVKHPKGYISINADETIEVVGPVKDAALALAKHIIQYEYTRDIVSLEINKVLRVDFSKNFELSYLKEEKPPFFDELAAEFQKIVNMKIFW